MRLLTLPHFRALRVDARCNVRPDRSFAASVAPASSSNQGQGWTCIPGTCVARGRGATVGRRGKCLMHRTRHSLTLSASATEDNGSFFLGTEENVDGTVTYLFGSKEELDAVDARKSEVDVQSSDSSAGGKVTAADRKAVEPVQEKKSKKAVKAASKPKLKSKKSKNANLKTPKAKVVEHLSGVVEVAEAPVKLPASAVVEKVEDIPTTVTKVASKGKSSLKTVNVESSGASIKDKTDKTPAVEDLGSLKVVELRDIARDKGLKGYSRLKKAELVEMLSANL